jgi:DNA-binding NarL/FixJ family response regulator
MIRVLLVDDHDFLRETLVEVVEATPDLTVVGECRDGSEVAAAVRRLQPDVVVMDIRMGTTSGFQALRDLRAQELTSRVVILTSAPAETHRGQAESLGAVGYLAKGGDGEGVLHAIRRVARGATAWPEDSSPLAGTGG